MSEELTVGCVQMTAVDDAGANADQARRLIHEAADAGATLVLTPENTGFMTTGRRQVLAAGLPEDGHPVLQALTGLARERGIWLVIGSLWIRDAAEERNHNRSFLVDPEGRIAARYDKIHMFDVTVSDTESYRESRNFAPGDRAVVHDAPFGRIGLTICYDLRFPHLYRALGQAGARLITVPAAFTRPTGAAHWDVLLRARAIETGAFILAPAQTGEHPGGRETYGHSAIVAPWGEIVAQAGTEPCALVATLDLAKVEKARGRVPTWQTEQDFAPPPPSPAQGQAAE
ncbi:carbon-nitrogen hydrolase family protein [Marinibaculum pumilum]|uniref:Carbon-nitrogen hydrolase family protein n=1 Tax=Marinibaculum pumilum TaxID=1766165 RepID=A0ABV7KTF8_9PROT